MDTWVSTTKNLDESHLKSLSGAFLSGSASEASSDPTMLVAWSIKQGKPIIVVFVKSVPLFRHWGT